MGSAGRLTRAPAGRSRWQGVWRKVHAHGLTGRNYGEGDWTASGELAALRYARGVLPAAPVVFDVGANVGGWSLSALDVWPAAQVHAFEPSTETHRALVEATAGHVTCVRAACSAEPGTA